MPKELQNVYGNDKAKSIIEKICESDRIPHAFIFSGPAGVGKFNFALRFSELANINVDKAIVESISKLTEPYIKYLFPLPSKDTDADNEGEGSYDSKILIELNSKIQNPYHSLNIKNASNISINQIRDINKFIYMNVSEVENRFVIIEDAHQMNINSQNAFLKNLEEPPKGIIFVLVTSYPEHLLDTIRSRCQEIKFSPLKKEDLQNIVERYFDTNLKINDDLYLLSEGTLEKLFKFNGSDFSTIKNSVINFLRASIGGRTYTAYNIINEYSDNIEMLLLYFKFIQYWLVDARRTKLGLKSLVYGDYSETLINFIDRYDISALDYIFNNIENYSDFVNRNINLNIVFLNIILTLSQIKRLG